MTFFELQEKDVISVEYTAYPTQSLLLDRTGPNLYEKRSSLILSGASTSGRIGTVRSFSDLNGNFLTQSYYNELHTEFLFSSSVSNAQKIAINRLREMYSSSTFYKIENYESSSIYNSSTASDQLMAILNIPSLYVGGGIKPGSLSIAQVTTSSITPIFSDDGYGGVYSGSALVGCMFYEYGIIYLGHRIDRSVVFGDAPSILVNFSATNHIPMNIYICNAPKGMVNFSTNPSYTQLSGTKNEITTDKLKTFISTVVLYDENFEPVGVAKVANPNLKEETDGIQYRLKLNF